MHAERRTMSISQLARKASVEFGKKVLWTTAYDATTGVHKSLTAKVRRCTLDQLCFSDEKLWRKVQTMCPQNKRCLVPKSKAKPDAVKAYTDDMQVVMKMTDRAGVMSGLLFSRKHGLGKQFFVPPEYRMVHRRTLRNVHGCL